MVARAMIAFAAALVCNRYEPTRIRRDCSLAASPHDDWSRRDFLSAASLAATMTQLEILPGSSHSAAHATEIPNFPLPDTIPFSTRRNYKHIILSNGLRVLLVTDKEAPRATAALSIKGAGQFQETSRIGGLAHLMEHMVSSAAQKIDFEDWLEEHADGASNAFTGPDRVCYHFSVEPESFAESLARFSSLFQQDNVEKVCRNDAILKREIKRVDSELDFRNDQNRAFYLVKSLVNKDHPFSRFTQGSYDSLERIPSKDGIDLKAELIAFFHTQYLASNAALVVIGPTDMESLERWVSPFSSVLSREANLESETLEAIRYPAPLNYTTNPIQYVMWHPRGDTPQTENLEKLEFVWFLDRRYEGSESIVSSTTAGFFIAQLVNRRGPGSLYKFLLRRGWIPGGNQGLPRITFPIDVSGFQLMRLDIMLTFEGFANRAAVVAALNDCLKAVVGITNSNYKVPDDLLKQYITVGTLHGYNIAPRPSDAVELAVDLLTYDQTRVGVEGVWSLLPANEDPRVTLDVLNNAIADILRVILDPSRAVIIVTACNKAILKSRSGIVNDPIPPPLLSDRWHVEPISGARYLKCDDMTSIYGYVEAWMSGRFEEDEILPPRYNPLIPSKLRPPRPIKETTLKDGSTKLYYMDTEIDTVWKEFFASSTEGSGKGSWTDKAGSPQIGPDWKLAMSQGALPLPMMPSENTCRCSITIQLLSSRPARANVNQGALAQLWMLSFEDKIQDLAELGAPGGLAYEVSFNKFGMRICFMGISQNLSAYAKRFCRRLVNHHSRLMLESEIKQTVVESTILDANRRSGRSILRKRQLTSVIQEAGPQEVSREGKEFLKSCSGALCLVQGDVLPKEAILLVGELKDLFDSVTRSNEDDTVNQPAVPELSDILYKPFWKPRSASLCSIPGVPLISDSCGRIPR